LRARLMSLLRRSPGDDVPERWIVVGLGNPGERYSATRHNAGVFVLEELLRRTSMSLKRHKSGCLVADGRMSGERVILARPATHMNESGRPVRELLRWYRSPTDRLIVIHDELDIPFGDVRIKWGGGTAGHNGLNSVSSHLGSKEFLRVRVGVSRPRGRQDPADYVLSSFSGAERRNLDDVVARAADAVERIVEIGAERAMNEVNTRPPTR
jgi:PTH1 family peptidyl-tRNA hydrolase